MTTWTLIRRSLRYHARAHFGALLGAAVGSAVLVGALVVGDSVRESLRRMALARLGIIDYAIHTGDRFFLASLDQRLLANAKRSGVPIDQTTPRFTYRDDPLWQKSSATALLLSGVAARQDGSARANRVNVLGVEVPAWPRFANWASLSKGFSRRLSNGQTNHIDEVMAMQIGKPEAILTRWRHGEIVLVNETLARQLAVREGDEIVLRVRKPTALAQDAVISSRDEVSVALRLKVGPVLSADLLGDFSLSANQIPPANAFLPLDFLGTKLAIPGRVNLLVQGPLKAKPRFSWLDLKREKLGQWIGKWWIKDSRIAQSPDTVPSSAYRIVPRRINDSVIGPKRVADPTPQEAQEFLAAELKKVWSLEDAELTVGAVEQPQTATGGEYIRPFVELTSSRIFLESGVVTAALTPRTRLLADRQDIPADTQNDVAFSRLVTNGVPVLTYLVNLIQAGDHATPYSMVTAAGGGYVRADLRDDEILVNEWLAEDLRVKPGDLVSLAYYVADSGSKLIERTNSFRVRAVVPIEGRYADRTLMPEFPGLAKAESTHDWDAGFPLVHEIREQDEAYWKQYRGTPKAFITLTAGQSMWASRFGALTAIRYEVPANSFASTCREAVYRNVLANLDPAAVGLHFDPVREQALKAATQSQDFGGLFLGFSFFLIVAALLLMALLFQFDIEQRATEVGTLLALGFTPRQVRRLLLGEGAGLALLGGLIGVAGGVGYARAMLHGLSTIWRSAVGTSALQYHARPVTLLIGAGAGVAVAWLTIWLALRKQAQQPARELLAEGGEFQTANGCRTGRPVRFELRSRSIKVSTLSTMAALLLIGFAAVRSDTAAAGLFFGAGALLLIGGLAFCSALIGSLAVAEAAGKMTLSGMGVRNATRRRTRSLATLGLLACGSFLIASIGVFRLDAVKGAEKRSSGTGGFALVGESTLPIVHDLNSAAGRNAYGLDAKELAGVEFVPFRLREGEDASCLNLNRAQKPRLLGVQPEFLSRRGAFTFAQVAQGLPRENLRTDPRDAGATRFAQIAKGLPKENPWLLLQRREGGVVPAIGDAASIQWALGKKVGDVLPYTDERGRSFQIRIVAAVANSMLQGNLILAEDQFVERFPNESGYRMFLIDAPSNKVEKVRATLSRALQDAGMELTPAAERLAAFNAVQNTYLSTFQVLGGLGLILGSIGLGVVVLRNVLERRSELALLLAVGFRPRALKWLVVSEHGALLLLGLGVGVVSAFVAVLPAVLSPGAEVPFASLGATLGAVLLSGAVWTWLAAALALRGDLLKALRNE